MTLLNLEEVRNDETNNFRKFVNFDQHDSKNSFWRQFTCVRGECLRIKIRFNTLNIGFVFFYRSYHIVACVIGQPTFHVV